MLDVVDQFDLAPFYRAHRDDRHGHPAYDPTMLLGVLALRLLPWCALLRQVERRCREKVRIVGAVKQGPSAVSRSTSERGRHGVGSQSGNRHVHWHLAPLPPGVPYEQQQLAAFSWDRGVLDLPDEDLAALAVRIGTQVERMRQNE